MATTGPGEDEVRARYERHVNPTFVKLLGLLGYGRVLVRAHGATVWDDHDRPYLDLLAGFGALNLGHNHPGVLAALRDVLATDAVHLCHTGPTAHEGAFAAALAAAAGPPFEVAMFSSTGAEAVEAGIKLARAATGRAGVVYCHGGFHGLSLGTLSIMGAPRLRAPFGRLLPDTTAVPFGELAPLERALAGGKIAAFVVEPIQSEAGVILPPPGYLAAAQAACRAHGTLLVLDEVQTGLGRTGTMFAYQAEGFVPDVLVLAKALGGGVIPVGATLCARAVHQRAYGAIDRFDAHGSTFAGNALACAAGQATLALTRSLALPARAAALGDRLRARLAARLDGHPMVRAIRGRGLLVGLEVGTAASSALASVTSALGDALGRLAPALGRAVPGRFVGQWLAVRLLEAGVLCQPASHHWDVLKLEPPLTITEAELDRAADLIADVLDENRALPTLVRDLGVRLASQGQRGVALVNPRTLAHKLRADAERAGRDARFALGLARKRPFQVLLQITNRCNMTCDFCDFWPNGVPPAQELTTADYQRLAAELDDLGTFLVSVEGGEPTVRKDLIEILRAFARRHVVVLYTNGWFMTAELAREIYDAGVAQVGVSIDYADDARHDARRGQAGATRRAWAAVEHLRRAAPAGGRAVHVMTVLMADNKDELPRLLDQSAAAGVGHWITLVSAAGYRRGAGAALPAAPVSPELLRLRARYPHFRVFRDYVAAIDDFLAHARAPSDPTPNLPTCHAGAQSFNIDHQGGVAPCIEHIDWTAGNVKDEPLAAILARLRADPRIAGCQACWTVCRGFAQVLGDGGTRTAWADLATRMRSW